MTVISRGLEGIVAASTKLSDVRGEEGILLYCGYDINELAQKVSYEETVYLLWNGRLPNRKELDALKSDLRAERTLPEPLVDYLKNIPKDACPMDTLRTGISMLGLYDKRGMAENAPLEEVEKINRARALSITAKVGIIAAYFHRARQGKSLPPIRKDLDEAAHFIYLMTGEEPNAKAVQTLDLCYVLHADHGLNASTFSARVCASTLTDMYSSVVAAIGALKGPLHGGANEGVIHMLEEIGSVDRVDAWLHQRLEKKQKIMGIGHRIYKVLDPRAPILKKMAMELSKELNEPQWMEIAEKIASIMLKEKNLYANVDFYSAIVYHCLGIPTDLFTPIFTIARTSGWTAHILEQCADNRLFRPLSEYVGEELGKKVIPIEKR